MKSFTILPLLLLGISACVLAAKQEKINPDLVNSNVERTIDLVSQLVKISSIVTLRNDGSSALKSFVLAVQRAEHLSFVGASLKSDDEKKDLKVTQTEVAGQSPSDGTFYKVDLGKSLAAGDTVDVTVETIFTKALRPYPAEIPQSEKQYIEFKGNAYFYSPYNTESQTTEVKLSSSTIEFYSKINPVTLNDAVISYGPYDNVEPFAEEKIRVHFENNNPFLVVTSMTRIIEVSHWGNIAVEETYDIYHSGAKLKGSFSRYDYQRTQDGYSSIKSFKTILPASAKDVYYRDEIGNISTSNLLEHDDHVELELRPRFPLFGGWKTHYVVGYNLPSYENLYNAGDKYILNMRLLDHIFDDMIVDELNVKVILPEGSKDIELKTSFSIERKPDELHFTYLDTIGRPVIVARKTNLVEQHIADFELHYSFNKVLLLQEPLLVIGAFFILFLTVIIVVRLDFSISKIFKSLKKNEYSVEAWKQHDLHPKLMTKETVDWIFVLDTLNFSFWSEANDKRFLVDYRGSLHSGYWALCAAINRALDENIPITSPSYYSRITMDQLRHVFRSATDTDIPLLDKRLEHLHEAGTVLLEKFEGSFVNCISQCDRKASKLLHLITENFPSYRDVAMFEGAAVSLYKRAQILIADIWACFEGKSFGEFIDIDVLTMFADYRVPQVLNYFEVIKYSPRLHEILQSGRLFTPGERLEVEIRGCSIWAVELIRQELKSLMAEDSSLSGLTLNSIIIDFYLWDYSKDHWRDMQHIPIHKIRSTFY